jgi:DivIVA domain-containing protein
MGAADATLGIGGPVNRFRPATHRRAITMNQPDTAAGKRNPERPPTFRVVLRGYDRAEVDDYLPQLMARLSEAVDRYAQGEQARAELERLVERARQRADNIVHKAQTQAQQLRAEVTSEAQKALAQARKVAEQIHREAEHERAALQRERQQVRELHDGLLVDLRRVHGDLSGLLARTDTPPNQAPTAAHPEPKAASERNGKADRPAAPGTVAEHQ